MRTFPTTTQARHFRPSITKGEWFSAFLPIAREAIARGDFAETMGVKINNPWECERHARYFANYAATDMVIAGRTYLLPMPGEEVSPLSVKAAA